MPQRERLKRVVEGIGTTGWLLAVITGFGLLYRLIAIDHESLWVDEAYTIFFIRQDYGELIGDIARNEFNPPLYYILLKAWVGVFGESVFAWRSLSAVIGALVVPVAFFAGRWAHHGPESDRVGLISATLMALTFSQLTYAHEARGYTMLVLGFAILTAASIRILRDIQACDQKAFERLTLWPYLLFGAGASLAFWSHYTAAMMILWAGVLHLVILFWPGHFSRALLLRYTLAAATFLVLSAPALWLFVAYSLPASTDFWISAPDLLQVIDTAALTYGADFNLPSWGLEMLARLVVFGAWPVIALWAVFRRGSGQALAVFAMLVGLSFGVFAVFVLESWAARPIFLQRILIASEIGWVVLCAMAFTAFTKPMAQRITVFATLAAFVLGATSFLFNRSEVIYKEPWKQAVELAIKYTDAPATIFTTATGELIINHYLSEYDHGDIEVVALPRSLAVPRGRTAFVDNHQTFSAKYNSESFFPMADAIEDGRIVWLIVRNPDSASFQTVLDGLAEAGAPANTRFYSPIGPMGAYRVPPVAGADAMPALGEDE